MNNWNLNETRDHINRLYGLEQLTLAKSSINSTALRTEYARYHYHEAKKLLKNLTSETLKHKSNDEIVLGIMNEAEQQKFATCTIKIEANVIACLSNIHSVFDTLAHVIYYSLGLNSPEYKTTQGKVSANKIADLIKSKSELNNLNHLLSELIKEGGSSHLSAMVNSAKHRGVERLRFSPDPSCKHQNSLILKTPSIIYKEKLYPEMDLEKFLNLEYNRIGNLNVKIGNEINAILKLLS